LPHAKQTKAGCAVSNVSPHRYVPRATIEKFPWLRRPIQLSLFPTDVSACPGAGVLLPMAA
jgi:hypothetical protein